MSGLLVAGTTSDAGKSAVTTGLCRALARRGVKVAPYKAQNMSNNSMVCLDAAGRPAEIGRAQWIQAVAAQVEPEPAMNPVLMKPGSDQVSHTVVMGHPAGMVSAANWVTGRAELAKQAWAAYDDLASRFDVVIAEGAGSPTEINLRSSDYVNLGLAQHAQLPVVVVGDIDRGGVFAALYGTVALLNAEDQARIAGFIINKFRGNRELLEPAIEQLGQLTGRRTFGVLPWDPDLWLDSEDSLQLAERRASGATYRVAVVRLPRISNFTDLDALSLEPQLDVVFVSRPDQLADADLVVLPGTRSTISDLDWLRSRGLEPAIVEHAAAGKPILGICGGFQLLGRQISDPDGIEGFPGQEVAGLGLLDVVTRFGPEKVLGLPSGQCLAAAVSGYEIHHGRLTIADNGDFSIGARSGNVFGTMWHGSLEGDEFRRAFLAATLGANDNRTTLQLSGSDTDVSATGPMAGVSFAAARSARINRLAELMEANLALDDLQELATSGMKSQPPALDPGARQ